MDRRGRRSRNWCLRGPGGARQPHVSRRYRTGRDERHGVDEHRVGEHRVVELRVVEHRVGVLRRGGADRQCPAVARAIRGIVTATSAGIVATADGPTEGN